MTARSVRPRASADAADGGHSRADRGDTSLTDSEYRAQIDSGLAVLLEHEILAEMIQMLGHQLDRASLAPLEGAHQFAMRIRRAGRGARRLVHGDDERRARHEVAQKLEQDAVARSLRQQ